MSERGYRAVCGGVMSRYAPRWRAISEVPLVTSMGTEHGVMRRAGKARDRGIAVAMLQGAQHCQRECSASRYVPVLVTSGPRCRESHE